MLNRYADGHVVGLALPRGAATRQVSRRPCCRHSLYDHFLGCRQTYCADGQGALTAMWSRRLIELLRRPEIRRRPFGRSRRDLFRRRDADGSRRHSRALTAYSPMPTASGRRLRALVL
jgi:hypothetical protein